MLVSVTALITPRTEAVAVAPAPFPPVIDIVGCDVYPVPAFSTRILVTLPFVTTACAVAPCPPPPTIEIRG